MKRSTHQVITIGKKSQMSTYEMSTNRMSMVPSKALAGQESPSVLFSRVLDMIRSPLVDGFHTDALSSQLLR